MASTLTSIEILTTNLSSSIMVVVLILTASVVVDQSAFSAVALRFPY